MSNENLTTKQRTALYMAIDKTTRYMYGEKFYNMPEPNTEMAKSLFWQELGRGYFLGDLPFEEALFNAEGLASEYLMKHLVGYVYLNTDFVKANKDCSNCDFVNDWDGNGIACLECTQSQVQDKYSNAIYTDECEWVIPNNTKEDSDGEAN